MNNINNFKIFETKQEAESFLSKNNISETDEKYLKLKEISKKMPALLGVLTKLLYSKKTEVSVEKVGEIINAFDNLKNDLKRDKISIQKVLVDSLKKDNPIEYIEDIINSVKLKRETLKFINSLQHSSVRNEIKSDYYETVENGIISLKGVKNWEKELDMISQKSARFKDAKSLIATFNTMVKNAVGGFSTESIVKKINENAGAVIVYNKFGIVVAQVFTREASCAIGSSSWCISGNGGSYFNQYANPKQGKQQYFIWDTSLSPSSLYSLVGITTHADGMLHTAHLKNDSYFSNVFEYYKKMVKDGKCDEELIEIITADTDTNTFKNTQVALHYIIYGKGNISTGQFKKIFSSEWNKSPKKDIDDFKGLFSLYFTVVKNKGVGIKDYNHREYVIYKRIHEKLKTFSLKLSPVDISDFLWKTTQGSGLTSASLVIDILGELISKSEIFKKLNEMQQFKIYTDLFVYRQMLDEKYWPYYPDVLKIPQSLVDYNHLDLRSEELFDVLNDIVSEHKQDVDYSVFKKTFKKVTIDANNLSNFIPGSVSRWILQELKCEELELINFTSSVLNYIKDITILNTLTLNNFKTALSKITDVITKNNIKNLVFNQCNTSLWLTQRDDIDVDSIVLNKSKIVLNDTNPLIDTNLLVVNHSVIKPLIMYDNHFHKIEMTSDVYYNLSDEEKEMVNNSNVKISGGLNISESMKSKLLNALYKQFKKKDDFKRFLKILGNNKIDLNNYNDDEISYIPSIIVEDEVKKIADKNSIKEFALVCVNKEEGFKYFLKYSKSGATWQIQYIDDKLQGVGKYSTKLSNTELSKPLIGDKKVYLNDIIDNTDYVLILRLDTTYNSGHKKYTRDLTKSGATSLKDEARLKDEFVGRYNNYIKNKYIFKVDGEKQGIQYVERVVPKITTLFNITSYKISPLFRDIKTYLSSDINPHNDTHGDEIKGRIRAYLKHSNTNDILKSINNYYYLVDDVKVFPDVDKLNTLKEKMVHLQNNVLIKYFRDNKINIEFMEDLDMFIERYDNILDYLFKLLYDTSLFINMVISMNVQFTDVVNGLVERRNSKNVSLNGRNSMLTKFFRIRVPHLDLNDEPYEKFLPLIERGNTKEDIKILLNTIVDEQIKEVDMVTRKLSLYLKM